MNLLGQEVKHNKYGMGNIVEFQERRITVEFQEGIKQFAFPDAFASFLEMKDAKLCREIKKIRKEQDKKILAQKERKDQENQLRIRMLTMKIQDKSQVAYNIPEDKIHNNRGYLDTGMVLTGKDRGTPRVPRNIQPNTGILLTQQKEGHRYIYGLAMADQFFWGNECVDGKILLHSEYQVILAEEHRISFWDYFKKEEAKSDWGSIPFKYFQLQTMEDLLYELWVNAMDTHQEEELAEFYRYFCQVNRISTRPLHEDMEMNR